MRACDRGGCLHFGAGWKMGRSRTRMGNQAGNRFDRVGPDPPRCLCRPFFLCHFPPVPFPCHQLETLCILFPLSHSDSQGDYRARRCCGQEGKEEGREGCLVKQLMHCRACEDSLFWMTSVPCYQELNSKCAWKMTLATANGVACFGMQLQVPTFTFGGAVRWMKAAAGAGHGAD